MTAKHEWPLEALADELEAWSETIGQRQGHEFTRITLQLRVGETVNNIVRTMMIHGPGALAIRIEKSFEALRHEAKDFDIICHTPNGEWLEYDQAENLLKSSALSLAEELRKIQNELSAEGFSDTDKTLSKEQPWADDAPGYLPLSDIRKLIDNALSLSTLSRLCKPQGEIRYMRKGQRRKAYLSDFRRFMLGHRSDTKWTEAHMNWLNGAKAGKFRMFWECQNPACGHAYPEGHKVTDTCPECNCRSKLTSTTQPEPTPRKR